MRTVTTANGITTAANKIWTFGLSITAEARADGFAVIVTFTLKNSIGLPPLANTTYS